MAAPPDLSDEPGSPTCGGYRCGSGCAPHRLDECAHDCAVLRSLFSRPESGGSRQVLAEVMAARNENMGDKAKLTAAMGLLKDKYHCPPAWNNLLATVGGGASPAAAGCCCSLLVRATSASRSRIESTLVASA